MPLTVWTERDELLSDALDNYDRALGLVDESHIADVDYEPMSEVEDAMERSLRNAQWGKVQDWRDLRQEIGKPVLTADDRDDVATATDHRRVVESRWRDGAACGLYIEQARTAEAMGDMLIEPEQWDEMATVWVEHTDRLQEWEEEVSPALEDQVFTTPSHEALRRYYAPAFLQGTKGSRCVEFVGVPSRHVAANDHVRYAMRLKAMRRRVTRPAKVNVLEWHHVPGKPLTSAPEFRGSGETAARIGARLNGAYTTTRSSQPAPQLHTRIKTGIRYCQQAEAKTNKARQTPVFDRYAARLQDLQVHLVNLMLQGSRPLGPVVAQVD